MEKYLSTPSAPAPSEPTHAPHLPTKDPEPTAVSLMTNRTTSSLAKVMALDVGKVRIGVAISDALGLTAQPLLTIHCKSRGDNLRNILRLARKHEAQRILVGNPIHLSGDQSAWSRKVQQFAAELATRTEVPIELVDERLSTRAAHDLLDEAHHPQHTRKQIIDQIAAVVILQTWMQAHANFPANR